MTLDGFLTFLTIVLAAYAVMPTATRLRVALHRTWLSSISVIALILVIYFEYFAVLKQPCPAVFGAYCSFLEMPKDESVTPSQLAFLVVGLWLVLASITMAQTRIPGSLPILAKLVSELVHQRRYGDLVEFLTPQLTLLERAASRKLLFAQIYDYLTRFDRPDTAIGWLNQSDAKPPPAYAGVLSSLATVCPSSKSAEEAAKAILRALFRTEEVAEYTAIHRPKFGVRLLAMDVRGVYDYCDAYMSALIKARQSALYQELRDNQNLSKCGYAYPAHNCLLYFLFSDAKNAERLAVWKPIGDFVVASLTESRLSGYASFLNGSSDFFEERDRWKDQTFVGIQFFDLMVTAAACQGIKWHMWLYYYPHFLRELIDIYDDTGDEIDRTAEWPTRGAYLIYSIVSNLIDWIEIGEDLPPNSTHLVIESVLPNHENGNIPKSAVLALGRCVGLFVVAENAGYRFRAYLFSMVVRLIGRCAVDGDRSDLRRALINSIVNRGSLGREIVYGEKLKLLFDGVDYILKSDVPDFFEAITAAYGE